MAWGILDRFLQPNRLLHRALLLGEYLATKDGEDLPAVLIKTLQDHFGAQHVCIHVVEAVPILPGPRDVLVAACPAGLAGEASGSSAAELRLFQHALSSSSAVTFATLPASLQDEVRPLLSAAGARDCMAVPLLNRGAVYAVAGFYFKKTVPPSIVDAEDVAHSIRLLGNLVYGALLQKFHESALAASDSLALAYCQAIASKDGYADGHTAWVCVLAEALGDAVGLSVTELDAVRKGAMFRDVGKMHVPEYILTKPGPLDQEERACVREHPLLGERILLEAASTSPENAGVALRAAATIVRSHHERLDGTGYPDGLAGAAVPLLARIVAIVDVYAALRSDRPYRAAQTASRATEVLQEMAGSALDPELVSLFLTRELYTAAEPTLSSFGTPPLNTSAALT
jgi:HD-GYP domain-containing protein (c-di-GMP phosphodiesterase class II)